MNLWKKNRQNNKFIIFMIIVLFFVYQTPYRATWKSSMSAGVKNIGLMIDTLMYQSSSMAWTVDYNEPQALDFGVIKNNDSLIMVMDSARMSLKPFSQAFKEYRLQFNGAITSEIDSVELELPQSGEKYSAVIKDGKFNLSVNIPRDSLINYQPLIIRAQGKPGIIKVNEADRLKYITIERFFIIADKSNPDSVDLAQRQAFDDEVLMTIPIIRSMLEYGNFQSCLNLLEYLVEVGPSNVLGELNYLAGFASQHLYGYEEKSIYYFNRALENNFDEYWVKYHRGYQHLLLGNTILAKSDLMRVLELEPTNLEVKQKLEEINSRF